MVDNIRVLQRRKPVYMRGLNGWRSWFKPVRCEANTTYSIQVKGEAGEWEDIPVVVEIEE